MERSTASGPDEPRRAVLENRPESKAGLPASAVTTGATDSSAHTWSPLLERVLRCPVCKLVGLTAAPVPECARCRFRGVLASGIPTFIRDEDLAESDRARLVKQEREEWARTEDENHLSCHWNRITASKLAASFGWPRGVILDLACGTGVLGGAFRRAGAELVGVDISLANLQIAKRRLDAVVRASALDLPFGDRVFDVILARNTLSHVLDPERTLEESRRVLRPGGMALFIDPRDVPWLEPLRSIGNAFGRKSEGPAGHKAKNSAQFVEWIGRYFRVEEVRTEQPLASLIARGLDHLPLPALLPKRLTAAQLIRLEHAFEKTPLRSAGLMVSVRARRPL